MKAGRWLVWQVGVKAPGTPIRTILPFAISCSVVNFVGPLSCMVWKVAEGRGEPMVSVMMYPILI